MRGKASHGREALETGYSTPQEEAVVDIIRVMHTISTASSNSKRNEMDTIFTAIGIEPELTCFSVLRRQQEACVHEARRRLPRGSQIPTAWGKLNGAYETCQRAATRKSRHHPSGNSPASCYIQHYGQLEFYHCCYSI